MEDWQRTYIRKNLVNLIRLTKCDRNLISILVQNEVLSDSDKHDLLKFEPDFDRSDRLYEILQTRPCYQTLLEALEGTDQKGAATILRQGNSIKRSDSVCEQVNEFGSIISEIISKAGQAATGTQLFSWVLDIIKDMLFSYLSKRENPQAVTVHLGSLEGVFERLHDVVLQSVEKLQVAKLNKLDDLITTEAEEYGKFLENIALRSSTTDLKCQHVQEINKRFKNFNGKHMLTENISEYAEKRYKEKCDGLLEMFLNKLRLVQSACEFCCGVKRNLQKFYSDQMEKRRKNLRCSIIGLSKLQEMHEQSVNATVASCSSNTSVRKFVAQSCSEIYHNFKDSLYPSSPHVLMTPVLAIDFGASGFRLAVLHNRHEIHNLPVFDIPPVVELNNSGSRKGETCRNEKNTKIVSIKRCICSASKCKLIDTTYDSCSLAWVDDGVIRKLQDAKEYYCEELLSLFLKHLKEKVEDYFQGASIKRVIIAVPTCFDSRQRQCILDSARIAGLDVCRLISDTLAIAAVVSCDFRDARKVLFVEMGASCFSATVVRVDSLNRICTFLGLSGDSHLGGTEFDTTMMDYCIMQFRRCCSEQVSSEQWQRWVVTLHANKSLHRLRKECEHCKKLISENSSSVDIYVPEFMEGRDLNVKLCPKTFNELSEPIFRMCREL